MKRRALSLLSLGHLTVDVTGGALVAMLPYLQSKFALSYLLLAAVSTTYQVTSSITQPIFGVISDRGAKRFLIPLGVLLAAGGFAVLGIAPTYPLVLAAVVVLVASAHSFLQARHYLWHGLAAFSVMTLLAGVSYFAFDMRSLIQEGKQQLARARLG